MKVGTEVWFRGINSGHPYIGRVVDVLEAVPGVVDDWGKERVMVRPLISIFIDGAGGEHVTDCTRSARWVQWCRTTDVVKL